MRFEYSFTYLKCQSCTAKIHCEACADEIRQRITGPAGVRTAEIDVPNRRMLLDAPGMDEMDLLDLLEEAGVFAD